ncbi:MAG: phosphoglycerate mutase (2,3-diphosphoglycerate-independent) [Bacilli bacterium]|nr:phosphoglycerate mutase (2,3-diphosphoglycerate-independent) [Bacilli bacterium]
MKKIILLIMDGFGYREEPHGNAIKDANMTTFNELWNKYPHSILEASGSYVGLPDGQFGNSEVCHTAIGVGKKIKQDITIINEETENNTIKNKEELINLIEHVKTNNSTLHLMGLLSDGGVHSDIKYMKKLIPILKEMGIDKIIFHAITDGRDTDAMCALKYINEMNETLNENNIGHIGTVCGRFYAMDRDNRWERTRVYSDLLINGKGLKILNAEIAIKNCYKRGLTDEFLPPLILNPEFKINEHDGLLWLNFRADRSRQILKSLTDISFNEYPIGHVNNLKVVSMFEVPDVSAPTLFNKNLDKIYSIGRYFSELRMTQARIAETEKYAHVTYFFNGGIEDKLELCDNFKIPSPKVATYDLLPEMSIENVTKQVLKCIEKDYDFILVNFANPDMVGHTGNYEAAVKSLKYVDEALKTIYEKAQDNFYEMLITSDHGNIDTMIDSHGIPVKTHSMSPVPFIFCNENVKLKEYGDITMIAPTILKFMDIKIPESMEKTPLLFVRED